jgi:hypothetical protein
MGRGHRLFGDPDGPSRDESGRVWGEPAGIDELPERIEYDEPHILISEPDSHADRGGVVWLLGGAALLVVAAIVVAAMLLQDLFR